MKLLLSLAVFGLIVACSAQTAQKWDRHTVNLDVITQQIDVVRSDVDHLVTLRQCPTSTYCIQTTRIEILEMNCATNFTDTDPDYLNFIGKSNVTGELLEKKVSKCESMNKPHVIDFGHFESEQVLIQPVGKAWTNGEVSAKINIVSEIQTLEHQNTAVLESNLRVFRNELIYLEAFIRNMFLFTSTLTVLAVALLITYFTLKITKMFRAIVATTTRRNTTDLIATAAPPPTYNSAMNYVNYEKSKF